MADEVLQWHDGFYAALQIELKGESARLRFCSEYELYKKSLRIDTVVIKESDDKPVQKNIGRIFRKHNLIEYKSPEDYLSIDDFYKVYGYACLYQSNTEKVHEISMEDITITFVCSHYPRKMLKMLKEERDIEVVQKGNGIYWLVNDPVSMQIIVVTQLPPGENRWLGSLKRNLAMDMNTKRLLREYKKNRESNLYQAAMDLIMRANQKTMEEAENMVCDALKEIFADEWKKKELQFQERETEFQERETEFQERETEFQERETKFQERETEFQEKEIKFQEKETQIQEKELSIKKREDQVQKKEMQLKKRENRMETLVQLLLKNNLLDELNKISVDKAYREQMYHRYGL